MADCQGLREYENRSEEIPIVVCGRFQRCAVLLSFGLRGADEGNRVNECNRFCWRFEKGLVSIPSFLS